MTLLLALAVLPSLASGPRDLQLYLATAAHYASGNHEAALREIRQWSPSQIEGATSALQQGQKRLRSRVTEPGEIDFHTVEAAVLLHAQAGLLSLQDHRLREAKVQLAAAVELQQWSRRAAAEARNWAAARALAFKERTVDPGLELREAIDARDSYKDRPANPRLELRESIDVRDFYVALATAALALGFPETARPFAEKASFEAPLDPEAQLVLGCAASGLAAEKALQHHDSDAAREREGAERAFRDALALDPGTHEARLRLGKLLLDEGRTIEAEPLLAEVDENAADDRQRYLARLFLGRGAERRGSSEEAIGSYRRALEAWPDSQAARLALAHALEQSSGPGASRELVAATLEASARPGRPSDPWFLYLVGPPDLASEAFTRVWTRILGP